MKILAPCLAFFGLAALTNANIVPNHLLCESRSNPQGIDIAAPLLSWQLTDTSNSERGQYQSAYRVQVASSPAFLAANRADLWDSGRVASRQTAQISYRGRGLTSKESCWWRVRVWDKANHASDWSEPSAWSMGLLNPRDWTAQWIGDPLLANPANRPLRPIHCYRSVLTKDANEKKWIRLDLGETEPIDSIDLIPARPQNENGDFRTPMFPVRFKLETSQTEDFSDARTVVDKTGSDYPSPRSNSCRFKFPTVSARYVRLTVTRLACWDGQDYGIALGGLAVFNGDRPQPVTDAQCSDSLEKEECSKRYLWEGREQTTLAPDSSEIAAVMDGVPAKSQVSRTPMLRREFSLDGRIRKATLYVGARGFYEVRINGERVGDELLSPGFTDYSRRVQYQTYDVTKLLRPGRNAIGALLGYGWYAGHMNLFDMRCIYGYFPQLLAQMDVEMANGRHVVIKSDRVWRSTLQGPIRWSDLLDGEGYDANREMPGWDRPGFDDRSWQAAWSQPRDATALSWDPCQPVRRIRTLRPLRVKPIKPGLYVFDFGQEITGWCRLKASSLDGAHIRLRHSELLAADGNIDVNNLWGTPQEEDYILQGGAVRNLEPHFTYHGFRYVELSGFSGPLKPDTLVAVNVRTDAAVTGQLLTSNDLYNRIQQAAARTQANLLFDVPSGCAARSERLAWTGDIRPCVPSLQFNFDASPLLAKYTQDLRDDQTPDGRFTDICPHAHLSGTDVCVGSPGWADAGVSLVWDTYRNTGDRRLVAQNFEAARRWVDFIHAQNPDLIWKNGRGMDWGDWLSAGPATPKELGATAFFAHSTDLVSRMAHVLGLHNEESEYRQLFQTIRKAFVRQYIDKDGSLGEIQGSYALALQFGLLDEPLRSQAARKLDELVVKNGHHPTTGFWSSIELLLALSNSGYASEAAQMLNQRQEPSWGYMADNSTTMWEAFDANSKNLSLNHWTHSAVSEWLWRNLAGINPDEAGYASFTIRPRPSPEVSWCHASYDSIRGRIACDWKKSGKTFEENVTIPVNTTATVFVPASRASSVTESGRKVSGIKFLRRESGMAVYSVGSGRYYFHSAANP